MKRNARTRRTCCGFTLFETVIVIALIAIVATLTVPSFIAWHIRDQVDARARTLLSTLSYARGEALRRGAVSRRVNRAKRASSTDLVAGR